MTRRAYDEAEDQRRKKIPPAEVIPSLFDTFEQDREAAELKADGLALGRSRRDCALDSQETLAGTAVALEYVRGKLVELYEQRLRSRRFEDAYVTADDADAIIQAWCDCPAEVLALPSQNWRGSIFRGKRWVKLSRLVESCRPHMHATQLQTWAVRREEAAA